MLSASTWVDNWSKYIFYFVISYKRLAGWSAAINADNISTEITAFKKHWLTITYQRHISTKEPWHNENVHHCNNRTVHHRLDKHFKYRPVTKATLKTPLRHCNDSGIQTFSEYKVRLSSTLDQGQKNIADIYFFASWNLQEGMNEKSCNFRCCSLNLHELIFFFFCNELQTEFHPAKFLWLAC